MGSGSGGLVKICGLTTADTIIAAIDAGADWIGFVFVPSSPRFITPKNASELSPLVPVGKEVIGLFADMDQSEIARIARQVPLDKVQMHGHETNDAIRAIRTTAARPIITARSISSTEDVISAHSAAGDYLLLDARAPTKASAKGGHGATFDWSLLQGFIPPTPWLLAGGLTPENIGSAVAAVRHLPGFTGVDVSSGVEITRGVKDPGLITAFVKAARTAMRPRT